MNMSKLLGKVEGFGLFGKATTQRVGDVVVATGVANDVVDPANDTHRLFSARRELILFKLAQHRANGSV